jgi:dTDP-4-dehydrorhamnose reductase
VGGYVCLKILITGAGGQLGRDLVKVLGGQHQLYPFGHDLDITDYSKIVSTISSIKPDLVIHAAAMTDVDGCELNPDQAFKVNALGTQNVALACRQSNAKILYLSTDFVFDGKKREPYAEFDPPNPLSVYGKSKLAGENYIITLLPNYFIVRTAWLYGREGMNFVKTILKLAEEKNELKVVNDQVGSPTYSCDLAQMIAKIIETDFFGTYHVTNAGGVSWYEFAKKILEMAGIKGVRVTPITSEELNRPAPRPAYSVLRNYVLELRGIGRMRNFEDALKDYFSEDKS